MYSHVRLDLRSATMKHTFKIVFAVVSAVVVASMVGFNPSWAATDAAALYKSKCSHCHAAKGEGKAAMKGTAIKGSGISADQIEQLLGQGMSGKKAPHNKAISGLNPEQVKALAEYVKNLQ